MANEAKTNVFYWGWCHPSGFLVGTTVEADVGALVGAAGYAAANFGMQVAEGSIRESAMRVLVGARVDQKRVHFFLIRFMKVKDYQSK